VTAPPVQPGGGDDALRALGWLTRSPALLAFVVALALNAVSLAWTGFDGLFGQDPYGYLVHAEELARHGSLLHHWPWEERPRLVAWPVGYPALIAALLKLGALLGVDANPAFSIRAGQLLSLLAWSLSCALLAKLTEMLLRSPAGPVVVPWRPGRSEDDAPLMPAEQARVGALLAGLMLALSPWGRRLAQGVMSDAWATLLTVSAVAAGLRAREVAWQAARRGAAAMPARAGLLLVLAGACLGAAPVVRHLSLVTMALLPLMLLFAQPWGQRWGRAALLWAVLSLATCFALYLPQLLVNHYFPRQFWNHAWMSYWSIWNMFGRRFETTDGTQIYTLPVIVFHLVQVWISPRLLTPLGLLLGVMGARIVLARGVGPAALLLGAYWLLPAGALSLLPCENERYAVIFLPAMIVLCAAGGARLLLQAPGRLGRRMAALGALAALVAILAYGEWHVHRFIGDKTRDLQVARMAARVVPPGASVLTFGLSLTLDRYSRVKVVDLCCVRPEAIEEAARRKDSYLLANPESLLRQFSQHPIGAHFKAAQGLIAGPPLAEIHGYRVWKLAAPPTPAR
jgi:hypothetical protein